MKIKELVVGNTCDVTLVVKSATARETRAKKPYLQMELYDGTDSINANYWDWSSGNIPAKNSIVDITAQVTEWQGTAQLNVKSMRDNTTMHLADFMPTGGADLSQVYKDAYALLSTVNDDFLRNLALALMEEMRESWLTIPGAVSVHHAYTGGTLVHSYSVAKLAAAMADQIPDANRDLCIVGGMLHDLGKLFTYRMNGIAIDMTDEGQLYEHIFMGAEFIGNFAENITLWDYYTEAKMRVLRHIILSHHGKLEYGSPVVPQCIEAFIVNAADGVDASAEQVRTAARKVPENLKWTERVYTLGNRAQLTPAYISTIMSGNREEVDV